MSQGNGLLSREERECMLECMGLIDNPDCAVPQRWLLRYEELVASMEEQRDHTAVHEATIPPGQADAYKDLVHAATAMLRVAGHAPPAGAADSIDCILGIRDALRAALQGLEELRSLRRRLAPDMPSMAAVLEAVPWNTGRDIHVAEIAMSANMSADEARDSALGLVNSGKLQLVRDCTFKLRP